jgi:hypothetical protein
VAGYLVIADQVSPVPLRAGVLRSGDQKRAGLGERVRVPSGIERFLPQDQLDVAAFPDAQAYPHVHLRADGVFSHGLLGWPLRGGDEVDRDGAAAPGDGVGAVVRQVASQALASLQENGVRRAQARRAPIAPGRPGA